MTWGVCNMTEMRKVLKFGVKSRYVYLSDKGRVLASFEISEANCQGIPEQVR